MESSTRRVFVYAFCGDAGVTGLAAGLDESFVFFPGQVGLDYNDETAEWFLVVDLAQVTGGLDVLTEIASAIGADMPGVYAGKVLAVGDQAPQVKDVLEWSGVEGLTVVAASIDLDDLADWVGAPWPLSLLANQLILGAAQATSRIGSGDSGGALFKG